MTEHCNIVAEAVNGSLVIKIDGYSRTKALLENGKSVRSTHFSVGRHRWAIKCYPNGCNEEEADFITFRLVLESAKANKLKVKFSFSLLDHDGEPVPSYCHTSPIWPFSIKGSEWGYTIMKKVDLERSVHLKDDSFTVRCDVTVMEDIHCRKTKGKQFVVIPPSNLHQDLGDLLINMDGADVTFLVGGKRFSAHRTVLAARSSVFKAEFFGPMKVKARRPITIDDMEGDVFKSLLHFIYSTQIHCLR